MINVGDQDRMPVTEPARPSIQRCLGSPAEPRQIRVFSPFMSRAARGFLSLAERALRFFLSSIDLQSFLAIALCQCSFSCASDGILLGERWKWNMLLMTSRCVVVLFGRSSPSDSA